MPAETQQPAKDPYINTPFSEGHTGPTIVMACVAMAGGVVSFYHKMKTGKTRAFNITEFVGEMVTSGLAGLIAGWVLTGMEANTYLVFAGVGIAGHMGSRIIFIAEQWLEDRVKKQP
jgi:hypothetical protein